jgi:formylmethanofuran dehydrogenase subunit B
MSIEKFVKASIQAEDSAHAAPGGGAESFTDYDVACHSWVCPGCSCLCDDISCYVKEGRVVRALNLCEVGWRRLSTISAENRLPALSPSLLSGTLREAAGLLRSRPPVLVLGGDGVDEGAIRASFELAANLQGVWLPWAFPGLQRFYERVRRFGWATALLDEVRDHAESVLFWRADPLETHHRHLSRYSFFARGRFTERGNLDRNLAAVASAKTVMEPLCQQFFQLPPDRDTALIQALDGPQGVGGFEHRDLAALVRALEGSSYVALFVDPEKVTDETLDALFRWSAKTNTEGRRRMVILPLWDAGPNIEGFCRVSLEKNATPCGADFSSTPGQEPSRKRAWEDLAEDVGSVLVISSGIDPPPGRCLPECLSGKPRVVIDPFKQAPSRTDTVLIPTALPGLESDGAFFRADGLLFDVRGLRVLPTHGYPTVQGVLADILAEVR